MTKRIFISILVATLAVFLASLLLIMGVLYDFYSHVQLNQLKVHCELTAHSVSLEGISFFDEINTSEYRTTWIDTDGTVIYDTTTDASTMENHLEREEIREAMQTGYGESSRYSTTLTERYIYSASKLPDGTIIRLSSEQYTVITLILGMLQPICLIILAAISLSLALAYRLSRYVVQPLNDLNLNEPLSNDMYEELTPLLKRIDTQQQQLRFQKSELQRKQDEFDAATAHMNEGLILLGKKGTILSMNSAASKVLGINSRYIGYSILDFSHSNEIEDVLSEANKGIHSEKMLNLGGRSYELDASPIISNNQVSGVALLLFDVTEKASAEQLRREFTANVSHELKTPLHSISGYAELMANGMVRAEDIGAFSEKIYAEAQRMISLVEDILHLSQLDGGADGVTHEECDLASIIDEVFSNLASAAELAKVTLIRDGKGISVTGIPQLIRAIIFNLCDNSIKYNRAGGEVRVSVSESENAVSIKVSDTGIGIPAEHIDRIFERFYRVDKSHSKEVGGTGLGLSIVKHAAKVHNAQISVSSRVGEGTEITVVFPK